MNPEHQTLNDCCYKEQTNVVLIKLKGSLQLKRLGSSVNPSRPSQERCRRISRALRVSLGIPYHLQLPSCPKLQTHPLTGGGGNPNIQVSSTPEAPSLRDQLQKLDDTATVLPLVSPEPSRGLGLSVRIPTNPGTLNPENLKGPGPLKRKPLGDDVAGGAGALSRKPLAKKTRFLRLLGLGRLGLFVSPLFRQGLGFTVRNRFVQGGQQGLTASGRAGGPSLVLLQTFSLQRQTQDSKP